jgi:ribosomal 50S subunit-recycling heat shock protein
MRLDKFLKVSRLIKRRTIAKEVCDQGRVSLNGQVAKSSSDVKAGDLLTIRFGRKIVTVRVEKILDTTKKEEAAGMYEVVEEKEIPKEGPEEINIW